jgi:hypothetical protein
MLVSHLRNMRSVAIAFAAVKLAPAGSTVCRIDGVTRRRLTGLDKHDQRNTMAMMVAAECPFHRAWAYDAQGLYTGQTSPISLAEAGKAIARHKHAAVGCGACGIIGNHVSRCPLA